MLICKCLKHSGGAELIKLLIMLKTQTGVRKKQEYVPQSSSDPLQVEYTSWVHSLTNSRNCLDSFPGRSAVYRV